ncbi:hypothetical protein AB1Y20_000848 [Prymnesium parvum]|uniref:MOSC domain-containing protein n=1 Tax=Prymnesium parvum TaxID=97485 RepID=A0AB34K6L8_PRYPA
MEVAELWIYPVKGCGGVRVESAKLTPTGFELDRHWCVVDLDGHAAAPLEALSKRKLPPLATIRVSLCPDARAVELQAEGMEPLRLPVDEPSGGAEEEAYVECSGRSTTHEGAGWSLGHIAATKDARGSEWMTQYLNRELPGGRLLSGRPRTRYGLMRSKHGLAMEAYPPVFPLVAKANVERRPEYVARFKGNQKRFADFAPLLLVNRASALFVGKQGGALPGEEEYPIGSFRGNVVVRTDAPWVEETWGQIEIAGVTFTKIKECPRCTVPCRDERTGKFLFPQDKMLLWRVLKQAFPRKFSDPEWGGWAGAFFGVYFGHAGQQGTLRVGDPVRVLRTVSWDAHLRAGTPGAAVYVAVLLGVCAILVGVICAYQAK